MEGRPFAQAGKRQQLLAEGLNDGAVATMLSAIADSKADLSFCGELSDPRISNIGVRTEEDVETPSLPHMGKPLAHGTRDEILSWCLVLEQEALGPLAESALEGLTARSHFNEAVKPADLSIEGVSEDEVDLLLSALVGSGYAERDGESFKPSRSVKGADDDSGATLPREVICGVWRKLLGDVVKAPGKRRTELSFPGIPDRFVQLCAESVLQAVGHEYMEPRQNALLAL